MTVIMLNVVLLSAVMLNVVLLSAVMLSVVMLSKIMLNVFGECRHGDCHDDKSRYYAIIILGSIINMHF